jgi:hypothetical protein
MIAKEFAAKLSGRGYPFRLTPDEVGVAKVHGLVVCYGSSDDLLEFEGLINDEVGAYNGIERRIDVDAGELMVDMDHEDYCQKCYDMANKIAVRAEWCPVSVEGASWLITSDCENSAPFDIVEDGAIFCRGIVLGIR